MLNETATYGLLTNGAAKALIDQHTARVKEVDQMTPLSIDPKEPGPVVTKFECRYCPRDDFETAHGRNVHEWRAHKSMTQTQEKLRNQLFECPTCHKTFKNKSGLGNHVRTCGVERAPTTDTSNIHIKLPGIDVSIQAKFSDKKLQESFPKKVLAMLNEMVS